MFMGYTNLTRVNLEGLRAVDMDFMESTFYDCKSLIYLNTKNLDTQGVESFDNIFEGIEKKLEVIYERGMAGTDFQLEINNNKNLSVE